VVFNGVVILRGYKDLSTDLWILPIPTMKVCTAPEPRVLSRPGPCNGCAPHLPMDTRDPGTTLVTFTHSVKTRANAVKFAHQSLCNPKISTLLKAIQRGFLKDCPNLSERLILKYLNPSTATAKGHMKRPRHGIRSTWPKQKKDNSMEPTPVPQIAPPVLPLFVPNGIQDVHTGPNVIADDGDEPIANIFCFGAFADKTSGVVYHDLTGSFPFMSFDGSVCFFVLYHYESNAILATPITGLDDVSIFNAYKTYFDVLTKKGFKPKLNIMDNQATKHIKIFLTENNCKLQVVEPHNHRVNAVKRAIQTFKAAFIAALATTDSDFPLQLWDRLTPQVKDTLNMLRASRIDPTKSAYEIFNGAYDWN
jgi:hypothetical protein